MCQTGSVQQTSASAAYTHNIVCLRADGMQTLCQVCMTIHKADPEGPLPIDTAAAVRNEAQGTRGTDIGHQQGCTRDSVWETGAPPAEIMNPTFAPSADTVPRQTSGTSSSQSRVMASSRCDTGDASLHRIGELAAAEVVAVAFSDGKTLQRQ